MIQVPASVRSCLLCALLLSAGSHTHAQDFSTYRTLEETLEQLRERYLDTHPDVMRVQAEYERHLSLLIREESSSLVLSTHPSKAQCKRIGAALVENSNRRDTSQTTTFPLMWKSPLRWMQLSTDRLASSAQSREAFLKHSYRIV